MVTSEALLSLQAVRDNARARWYAAQDACFEASGAANQAGPMSPAYPALRVKQLAAWEVEEVANLAYVEAVAAYEEARDSLSR